MGPGNALKSSLEKHRQWDITLSGDMIAMVGYVIIRAMAEIFRILGFRISQPPSFRLNSCLSILP